MLQSMFKQFSNDKRDFNMKLVNYMDTLTTQIIMISETFKEIQTDLRAALNVMNMPNLKQSDLSNTELKEEFETIIPKEQRKGVNKKTKKSNESANAKKYDDAKSSLVNFNFYTDSKSL